MSLTSISQLDFEQVLPHGFDDDTLAHRVNIVAGTITVNEAALASNGGAAPAEGKVVAGIDSTDLVRYLRTDVNGELQVRITGSVLPTGAATEATLASFSAKTAGADITVPFDATIISYVGITDNVDTILYKTGGVGGTTVKTKTFIYDGQSRIINIVVT
jgi:opacity protein-like surface antigen